MSTTLAFRLILGLVVGGVWVGLFFLLQNAAAPLRALLARAGIPVFLSGNADILRQPALAALLAALRAAVRRALDRAHPR